MSGGEFLTASPANGTTPGTLTVGIDPTVLAGLAPGTYQGTVTVSSPNLPGGNQVLNVTLAVAPGAKPAVTQVQSAASGRPGSIAPGEILSIFGTNIGPATAQGLELTPEGKVATTLANTQVTFDGVAGALTLVSANQINVIVPYEVAGRATTAVVVTRNGTASDSIEQRVAETAPSIFTQTMTGTGQGAILNQDSSVNSATNPAEKGSVIVIYATGEGQVNPAGVTASVTGTTAPFPMPTASVTVMIGGKEATVVYAGAAPGLVAGALQVNAIVPADVLSGNVPVVLKIGENNSQDGVTVAVE
jgi:uncharacterized protein (TIGR03437 family)